MSREKTKRFRGKMCRTIMWLVIFLFANMGAAAWAAGGTRFSVSEFSPQGLISGPVNIKVDFSSAVVASDDVGRTPPKELVPVVFSPPINGQGIWITRSTFLYQLPGGYLPEATAFEATIPEKLEDYEGRSISGGTKFKFNTPPMEFLGIRQTDYREDQWGVEYQLQFNAPLDLGQLRSFLSIKDGRGENIPFDVVGGTYNEPRIRVEAGDGSPLTFGIKKGLVSTRGPLAMKNAVLLKVDRDLSLKILDFHSYSDYSSSQININTTSQADADKLMPFVEITPKHEFYVSTYGSTISISGQFPPRELVTVKLKSGLPALSGPGLANEWVQSFIFPDHYPSLEITSPGRLISPANEELIVPFASVNIEKLDVTLERVYDNNVSFIMRDEWPSYIYNTAETIYRGDFEITAPVNERYEFSIDLRKMLDGRKGIFMLTANGSEKYWLSARRLINVTDMAGSAKIGDRGVLLWVNSIRAGTPIEGVSVELYSRTNQLVASGITDSHGACLIKNETDWPWDNRPSVAVMKHGDDTSILRFDGNIWQTGSADYGGDPYQKGGYEGYIYLPRDVFRPGETVPLQTIVRKSDLLPEKPFPVNLKVYTSLGREWLNESVMLSEMGMGGASINLSDASPTGAWRAEVRIPGEDTPIAYRSFQVEDFAPPRIEVEVSADQKELRYEAEPGLEINAKYLFGASGDGLDYEVERSLIPREYRNAKWPGYIFSDFRINAEANTEIQATGKLDKDGSAKVVLPPIRNEAKSMMDAVFKIGVREEGGRWVYKNLTLPYFPRKTFLGIKTPQGDIGTGEKTAATFAAIDTDGKPVSPEGVKLTISRELTRTIITTVEGRRRSEIRTEYAPMDGFDGIPVAFKNGVADTEVTFNAAGRYLIVVEDEKNEMSAAASLYVYNRGDWWYGDDETSATLPEYLSVELDKEVYRPGEKAVVTVRGSFEGTTLLSVETDEVLHYDTSSDGKKTAEFTFEITEDMTPNAWVTAHHVKAAAEEDTWSSHRAFGAAPIYIDRGDKKMRVEIKSPQKIRPAKENKFTVELRDGNGKEVAGEFTAILVDEGVLDLTAFKTPDFYGHFMRKRALTLLAYDVYAELMPLYLKTPAVMTPGGGATADMAMSAMMKASLSPVRADRFKILTAVKSVKTDENGKAEFSLDVPEFSGTARMMVVAASREAFGAVEEEHVISREVVADITLPRAVAPGDRFESNLQMFNRTDHVAEVNVLIKLTGPLSIAAVAGNEVNENQAKYQAKYYNARIKIPVGERAFSLPFSLRADDASGIARVTLETSFAGESQKQEIEMAVRPPYPRVSKTGSSSVKPGVTANVNLEKNWFPGTRRAIISTSSLPSVSMADMAKFLLDYPYWCLEQTVSRGWALLELPEIAARVDENLATRGQAEAELRNVLRRIQSMQLYDGSFSFWPSGASLSWTTVYATHFLVECEKKGIDVPRETIRYALESLRYLIATTPDPSDRNKYGGDLAVRAYVCYVLSLKGEAPLSWMAYLRDNISSMPEFGRLLLAAAFAESKDMKTASLILGEEAIPQFPFNDETQVYFDSGVRTDAMNLLARVGVDPFSTGSVAAADNLLNSLRVSERYTTQELAWSLLALSNFYSFQKNEGSADLEITGVEGENFAPLARGTATIKLDEGISALSVTNRGDGVGYVTWTCDGVPLEEPAPENIGMRASVTYYNSDGYVITPDAPLRAGEKITGEIMIESFSKNLNNMVISLPLAGGLEIENAFASDAYSSPNEYDRSNVPSFVTHVETRDDRILFFVDNISRTYKRRFTLRAITPGVFTLPPIAAEGMYSPGIRSIGQTSRITIK
ncbi:MAG: hypothetical protein LBS35_00965 [Synergistaceae bacterium]|nr:hypothetical protein [Synergistaceae bacterium]